VDISFTVNDKSGNSVEDPEIVVEAGQGEMYTYTSSERTHAFGARAGSRDVAVSADGFITEERSLVAAEDHDLTVELEREEKQPACSDGIDNDGDGVADENDSGCVDTFASTSRVPGTDGFVYEPEDDNEVLKRLTTSSTARALEEFVSSKEGERILPIFGWNFPKSIAFAVGPIDIRLKNMIETSQTGEAFALEIQCGPASEPRSEHTNKVITNIVPDDQSVDGWRESPVHGFTREILQNGTDCGFTAIHASKVRGEEPGDGNDDIFFSTSEQGGGSTFEWYYEEEEVQ
jgi:hypothetical protein